jgi:hypothetical protein
MDSALPPAIADVPPHIAGVRSAPRIAPPVIAPSSSVRRTWLFHPGYAVLLIGLAVPFLCALGIASFFFLSSPTRALRNAVLESVPGHWHKRFAVNVGPFTFGLARFGLSFAPKLPPEARTALGAIRDADVGVYHLDESSGPADYARILQIADKSMHRRGWERIVGVVQDRQFVAVYAPDDLRSVKHMACSVVVLNERDLVVVSAHGDITSLIDMARQKMHGRIPIFDSP